MCIRMFRRMHVFVAGVVFFFTQTIYIGHNYIGHNYIGHNYTGHSYMGHTYIGHNSRACSFPGVPDPPAAVDGAPPSRINPSLPILATQIALPRLQGAAGGHDYMGDDWILRDGLLEAITTWAITRYSGMTCWRP